MEIRGAGRGAAWANKKDTNSQNKLQWAEIGDGEV
jgi:hypothetical protein